MLRIAVLNVGHNYSLLILNIIKLYCSIKTISTGKSPWMSRCGGFEALLQPSFALKVSNSGEPQQNCRLQLGCYIVSLSNPNQTY